MKKIIAAVLCTAMLLSLAGCKSQKTKDDYKPVSGLDTSKNVTINIAIPYETNKALNTVANSFMEKYPNVNIKLEYIEDYDENAVRLFKENSIDIIFQRDVKYEDYTVLDEETEEEIPDGTNTDDFYYDFSADKEIDFSDTTSEIAGNYCHTRVDESGNSITYQYSYPLGGETRGVFVNKTLLAQYGLVAVWGGGDTAAYGLGLAPAANAVVHNDDSYNRMKNAEAGVSEEFADTINKLYTISTNRYFDYKLLEEEGYFSNYNELGQAESFLGLSKDPDTLEVIKPENNYGYGAFFPYISSAETVIQTLIEKNELDTEIEFIYSPLNDEGTNGSLYITPYYGICANKNSENLVWVREFVNFLFQEENNKSYAKAANIIPDTADAMQYAADKYGVNACEDITLCGQIRFSNDYNGYSPLAEAFKDTLKCSAQKYMVKLDKAADGSLLYQTDEDGGRYLLMGNGETKVYEEFIGEEDEAMPGYAFCRVEYYMNVLEEQFEEYRTGTDGE